MMLEFSARPIYKCLQLIIIDITGRDSVLMFSPGEASLSIHHEGVHNVETSVLKKTECFKNCALKLACSGMFTLKITHCMCYSIFYVINFFLKIKEWHIVHFICMYYSE